MSWPTLVRDVMRPPVLALQGMWFREMVRLLRDRGTEFLMVVDAEGRAVGAVTEEDLLLKMARGWLEERGAEPESASRRAQRRKATAVTARELMNEPLVSVAASVPAAEAARVMRERGVRHLAVLDPRGWPVGVVDRADLIALLVRPDEAIRQDVEDRLARELRGRADAVGVEVCDGVVLLRRRRDLDLPLEDVLPDVLEVEGVLAARVLGDSVADRWRCPP
jgi:CBS-domain-containing membrane protein